MNNIIEISNLSKSYNDLLAVSDISFKVKEGEFFAFLGVNGAGKSTTISIMCGQLSKDSGEVIVNGHNLDKDIDKVRKDIGVVFQASALDKPLSVKDNLKYRAGLYGICGAEFEKKLNELCKLFDLDEILNRPIKKLSGGQKRRVDIARALLHDPKILILDEPTTGLDPQTRKNVWDVIHKLRKERGLTVFLTTHYMEEVIDADYVVILDSGKIVAEGTPIDLKNKYTGDYITFYNVEEDVIKNMNLNYTKIRGGYRVEVENTKMATKLVLDNPDLFVDYEITKGKMDDVFLAVTGKDLKGGN
ncbi:MAG: ABC transporter ATP-binding protein [Anaeroplasma sp.]|nr:ABC transporter ATP-binding protein [Anaeroplasma sp.]